MDQQSKEAIEGMIMPTDDCDDQMPIIQDDLPSQQVYNLDEILDYLEDIAPKESETVMEEDMRAGHYYPAHECYDPSDDDII